MVCYEIFFVTIQMVSTVSTRTDNENSFISAGAAAEKETMSIGGKPNSLNSHL